jgi:hypothetical protein
VIRYFSGTFGRNGVGFHGVAKVCAGKEHLAEVVLDFRREGVPLMGASAANHLEFGNVLRYANTTGVRDRLPAAERVDSTIYATSFVWHSGAEGG